VSEGSLSRLRNLLVREPSLKVLQESKLLLQDFEKQHNTNLPEAKLLFCQAQLDYAGGKLERAKIRMLRA